MKAAEAMGFDPALIDKNRFASEYNGQYKPNDERS